MGKTKRLFEKEEEKRNTAVDIAIKAGVLKRCSIHDCTYLGGKDIEDAYKLGSFLFKRGELNVFGSQRDVTDAIQSVVDDHWAESCPDGQGYCS